MTGLSHNFENEAIGEANRWSRTEGVECCRHRFAVLKDQIRHTIYAIIRSGMKPRELWAPAH